jgi:hypothetical protein
LIGHINAIRPDFLKSVFRRPALHRFHVRLAIGRATGALAFPDHLAQALHGDMVGIMQGVQPRCEQLNRLPYTTGLVYGALLADGQMHGQMQKRVGFAGFPGGAIVRLFQFEQCSIHIAEISVVLRVFIHPLTRYYFNSFQRRINAGFGINRAKKTAHIGLGGLIQHARILVDW